MLFKQLIDEFLDKWDKDTSKAYRKKIYSFYQYLVEMKNATDSNYKSILKGLEIEDVAESIIFYVKRNQVKYRASADLYISTVKSFYAYISAKQICSNIYFDNKAYAPDMKEQCECAIKCLKLNESKQVMPLDEEAARRIVDRCNEIINLANYDELINGKWDGTFSAYVSALISKLVLCFGMSNKTIRELKAADYNSTNGRIVINGYSVHLPDTLKTNMDTYMDYRTRAINELCNGSDVNQYMFIELSNPRKNIPHSTKLFFILNELIGSTCATALAKYAIIQLIRQGIPAYLIKDFTGYKDDIYNHCQEIVNEENGAVSKEERCKIIDAGIRMSRLSEIV